MARTSDESDTEPGPVKRAYSGFLELPRLRMGLRTLKEIVSCLPSQGRQAWTLRLRDGAELEAQDLGQMAGEVIWTDVTELEGHLTSDELSMLLSLGKHHASIYWTASPSHRQACETAVRRIEKIARQHAVLHVPLGPKSILLMLAVSVLAGVAASLSTRFDSPTLRAGLIASAAILFAAGAALFYATYPGTAVAFVDEPVGVVRGWWRSLGHLLFDSARQILVGLVLMLIGIAIGRACS